MIEWIEVQVEPIPRDWDEIHFVHSPYIGCVEMPNPGEIIHIFRRENLERILGYATHWCKREKPEILSNGKESIPYPEMPSIKHTPPKEKNAAKQKTNPKLQ